jgi:hypothetical protein
MNRLEFPLPVPDANWLVFDVSCGNHLSESNNIVCTLSFPKPFFLPPGGELRVRIHEGKLVMEFIE